MQHTTIAIDLAKSVFEVGISDRPGHVCEQHRLSRSQLRYSLRTERRQPSYWKLAVLLITGRGSFKVSDMM
jgi:hypothetical protein